MNSQPEDWRPGDWRPGDWRPEDWHPGANDEALGRAALHALGALDAATAETYEAHLRSDPDSQRLFESIRNVVLELGLCCEPQQPPAHLLARLMERVQGSGESAPARVRGSRELGRLFLTDTGGKQPANRSFFRFATTGDWQPTKVDGIDSRTLFLDEANDRATMLFRMAPGTAYPAHRHAGDEECFVLEGHLQVGEVIMQKGDYQFSASGSVHPPQCTDAGCLLLISTSLHDEVLD